MGLRGRRGGWCEEWRVERWGGWVEGGGGSGWVWRGVRLVGRGMLRFEVKFGLCCSYV